MLVNIGAEANLLTLYLCDDTNARNGEKLRLVTVNGDRIRSGKRQF